MKRWQITIPQWITTLMAAACVLFFASLYWVLYMIRADIQAMDTRIANMQDQISLQELPAPSPMAYPHQIPLPEDDTTTRTPMALDGWLEGGAL